MLSVAAASVLLGTLYPLFLDVLDLGKVSVGAPYFNSVFVPLMTPMILIMGLGPFLNWKRGDAILAFKQLQLAAIIALTGAVITWFLIDRATVLAAFGIGLSIWLFFATLSELAGRIQLFRVPFIETLRKLKLQPRSSWGMTLAHGGLALVIAGMTASSAWRVESIQSMKPGDTAMVSGFEFTLKGVRNVKGPNYVASRANFDVTNGASFKISLEPEKRIYTVSRQPTTEAGIYATFLGDLYAVIGDPDGKGGFITRLYFNPLVTWMWFGTLLMVLGAGISLSDRRHRVGAPARRKLPSGATAQT